MLTLDKNSNIEFLIKLNILEHLFQSNMVKGGGGESIHDETQTFTYSIEVSTHCFYNSHVKKSFV